MSSFCTFLSSRRFVVFARSLVFFLLILAVVELIHFPCEKSKNQAVCLIDVSASTEKSFKSGKDNPLLAIQNRAFQYNRKIKYIPFAEHPFPIQNRCFFNKKLDADANETDIAAAITAAANYLTACDNPEIFLFSDGNETVNDAVSTAREYNIPIYSFPIQHHSPEASLNAFDLPSSVHIEEPFKITVKINTNQENRGTLSIFRDNLLTKTELINLSKGENLLQLTTNDKEEGTHTWKAAINAEHDSIAENNQIIRTVKTLPSPKLLLVSVPPDDAESFRQKLLPYKYEINTIRPEELPESLDRLREFSTILLSNIAVSDLTSGQIDAIEEYVCSEGKSVFLLGGLRTFAAGNYEGTLLEDLLPVRSVAEPGQVSNSAAFCFLIDRSGSMKGEKLTWAKNAVIGATKLLHSNDRTALIAFDQKPEIIVPMGTVSMFNSKLMTETLSINAGGGTNLETALQKSMDVFEDSANVKKHIILLTDGVSPEFDSGTLCNELNRRQISLSAITLGNTQSALLPKMLAEGTQGVWRPCVNSESIARFFTEEVSRIKNRAVEESQTTPQTTANEPFTDFIPFPAISGYVQTEAKPESEILLTTEDQYPLLARWRVGLGLVTVWTSDITGRWNEKGLASPKFGAFWSSLIRQGEEGFQAPSHQSDYPAELRCIPTNTKLLEHLSEMTGGAFNPDPESLFKNTDLRHRRCLLNHRWLFTILALVLVVFLALITIPSGKMEPPDNQCV